MSGRGGTAKRGRGRGRGGAAGGNKKTPAKKEENSTTETPEDYFKVSNADDESKEVKAIEQTVEASEETEKVESSETTEQTVDDSILDEDVVKEGEDKKAEVEAEAENEGGDADEILEEDDLIMEGSDPVVVEIKDSVDGDEVVDLCDDKEEKEEKGGKEEDAKDDKPRKRRVYEPSLQDFRIEFHKDRFYRSLLIEPLTLEQVNTSEVQELLSNSDRFFYRSVAEGDKQLGHLEIRLRSIDQRVRVVKDLPKQLEGVNVHTIKSAMDFKKYKTLGTNDEGLGMNISHNCIVSVYDLPSSAKHTDLITMFPGANRVMMGPPRSSSHDAGYAYLLYTTKEEAKEAMEKFRKEELKIGEQLLKFDILPVSRPKTPKAVTESRDSNKTPAKTDKKVEKKPDNRSANTPKTNYNRDRKPNRSSPARNRNARDNRSGGRGRNDRDQGHGRGRNDRNDRRRYDGRRQGNQGFQQQSYRSQQGLLPQPMMPSPLLGGLNQMGGGNQMQGNQNEAVNLLVGLSSVLGAIQKQQPQQQSHQGDHDQHLKRQRPQHSNMGEYEEGGYSYEDDRRGNSASSSNYFAPQKRPRIDDYY